MKIYGILGKDISYSLSPFMYNAAFKALNLEAEYKIFDIPENELDGFFSRMRKGEISGCNVTIPY
ncbi:MAG: shikimate dehydrogenase, partial [Candidatus Omnitrophota bacterium]